MGRSLLTTRCCLGGVTAHNRGLPPLSIQHAITTHELLIHYATLRYCNQVVLWARVEKLGWMCISRLTQTTQILFADLEKGKGNQVSRSPVPSDGEGEKKTETMKGSLIFSSNPPCSPSVSRPLGLDYSNGEGGIPFSTKLAAGLRSVARNYKATRLLTRPG